MVRVGVGRMGLVELVGLYGGKGQVEEGLKVMGSLVWDSDHFLTATYALFGLLSRQTWTERTEGKQIELLNDYKQLTFDP